MLLVRWLSYYYVWPCLDLFQLYGVCDSHLLYVFRFFVFFFFVALFPSPIFSLCEVLGIPASLRISVPGLSFLCNYMSM